MYVYVYIYVCINIYVHLFLCKYMNNGTLKQHIVINQYWNI